ncbi:MAG: hypothetical protein OXH97_08950 [Chloroflexota bacterium]|nr:hypothetical protein [Chloroflexota bacterium]
MVLAEAEQTTTKEDETTSASRFDWFEGGTRGARSFPTCSLTKSGSMTLNDVAVQALGDPPAIRVGYDAEQGQIGLRASLRDEAGAILLRPSRTPEGADTGSRSMYARAVLAYYGVLPDENHTFRLDDIGGGVFALSLDDPLPKSRSRRTAKA